jgi:phosphohistidine swiveling domain-containing protein
MEAGSELGGKGAALDDLRRRGLPVPPGIVVPARVFRQYTGDPETREGLRRLGAAYDRGCLPAPDQLGAAYPELARAVSWLRLHLDEGLRGWRSPRPRWFIARSSATGEDGDHCSFAGVLESFPGLHAGRLAEGVLLCWAALFTARCRAYCERRGLSHDELSTAVVIEEMVPAESSGILLTHDPTTGEEGPLIEAVRGLPTTAVEGLVQPERHRRMADGSWEVRPGAQAWQDVLSSGGLRTIAVAGEDRGRSVLAEPARVRLCEMARRVAEARGGPQDIEWAMVSTARGPRLFLLQARPITTIATPARLWTRANLRELYPELPSPMTASLIERYRSDFLVDAFARCGFPVRHLSPSVRFIHGRPFLNQSLMVFMAEAFGADPRVVRESIGGDEIQPSAERVTRAPGWRRLARYAAPAARLIRRYLSVGREAGGALARASEAADRMNRTALQGLTDGELLEGVRRCSDEICLLEELATVVAGASEIWRLAAKALLTGRVASPAEFLAAVSVAGDASVTGEHVRALDRLAHLARVDDAARSWLLSGRSTASPPDGPFAEALREFLARFGCRAMHESDSAVPRFSEQPEMILRTVRATLRAGGTEGADREEQHRGRARDAWMGYRRRLPAWERLLPARTLALAAFTRRLQRLYALRESVRLAMARLVAAQRRWELELGRRWARRGWLARQEEYHWLRIEDAEHAAAHPERMAGGWLRDRAAAHRREHEDWAEIPVPDTWDDARQAVFGLSREPRPGPGAPHVLRGLPVSPGVVEGDVVVVSGPEQLDRVVPGCILVTPIIGPSWTPILAMVSGLVAEMGGALSHGSILAREYGLPTVANVPGATRLLRSGERIRLDGSHGMIHRLENAGDDAEPDDWEEAEAVGSLAGGSRPPY